MARKALLFIMFIITSSKLFPVIVILLVEYLVMMLLRICGEMLVFGLFQLECSVYPFQM